MSLDRINLLDVAMRLDPDKKTVARIVEKLDQHNPMLQDAPAFAGNAPMGNVVTRRSSLPTVGWSRINEGYSRSKSSTEQHTDTMGLLKALSETDTALEKIHGSAKMGSIRWGEDKSFLEAISQELTQTMIYGNELTEEAAFTGFQPRLETLNTGITASQVKAHHGSPSGSDYTSIYIVDWGEDGASLIYPEGSSAGVDQKDLGIQLVSDADSNQFSAYVTQFIVTLGLAVKDARHIARLCNIDVSQAQSDTSVQLVESMIDVLNSMPPPDGLNRVIYCHREIIAAWKKQVMAKSNVWFSFDEYLGKKHLMFDGHPVRRVDQLTKSESLVS